MCDIYWREFPFFSLHEGYPTDFNARFLPEFVEEINTNEQHRDHFALRKKLDILFLATGSSFIFSVLGFDTRGFLASISSSAKSSSKKRKFGDCLHTWISVVFYRECTTDRTHMNLLSMFTLHSIIQFWSKIIDEQRLRINLVTEKNCCLAHNSNGLLRYDINFWIHFH